MPTKSNRINIRDVYHRHRPRYDESVVLAVHVGFWLYFVYGDAYQVVKLLGEPPLEKADYPQVAIHDSRWAMVDDRLDALGIKLVVYGPTPNGRGCQIEERKYDLSHFERAHLVAYEDALSDLQADRLFPRETGTDWLFPRLRGLDFRIKAIHYRLRCLAEARAYLKHPTLGAHLRELTDVLLAKGKKHILDIFDPLNAMNVQASLTLFSHVSASETRFREALVRFYEGMEDAASVEALSRNV